MAATTRPSLSKQTLVPSSNSHLPRILCLHGGGTNATIFSAQCRSLSSELQGQFRLIFANAPFYSGPGPDVESVYANWGPFRSWVRPPKTATPTSTADARVIKPVEWTSATLDINAVDTALENAIAEDDRQGGKGEVMGLLGFSQGARMAGCLLLRRQLQEQQKQKRQRKRNKDENGLDQDVIFEPDGPLPGENENGNGYRFAVLIAGRGPLIDLDFAQRMRVHFHSHVNGNGNGNGNLPPSFPLPQQLHLPTIHIHGMRDTNLALNRDLLYCDCVEDTARLIEWDGDHRVPIKTEDVAPVVNAICDVARETGTVLS
ncbi:serine hydrolase FSH [Aspergillus oleicola]